MSAYQAIKLRNVVKRFGNFTAVNNLNLDVPAGSCIGLLGPNGAGKSTTMRMLTAQAIADEGDLEVLGYALPEQSKKARAICGVVPQQDNLDETLTVEQNLIVFTHLYRVASNKRKNAIETALQIAKLTDKRDVLIGKLSGGMRRRLLIARALIHNPKLVLLDEPTVGLDPQVRHELWALIDNLRNQGTSILMTTHYIEEAERLCDSVTVMSKGRAVDVGKPKDLIQRHTGGIAWEIHDTPKNLDNTVTQISSPNNKLRRTGTSVVIFNEDPPVGFEQRATKRIANLEDVFVLLTGEVTE